MSENLALNVAAQMDLEESLIFAKIYVLLRSPSTLVS